MWDFRKIQAIEEPVFNNTLEKFYNLGIDGLVRENIQNSLDAKLQESELPVEVTISVGEMDAADIPGVDEIKQHIIALKGQNTYTRETIDHMQSEMARATVSYISFEDCNTKGLTGAMHGENCGENDTWGAYAYKKGVHQIVEDAELENLRGGSHGVGKIACNAASDLYMMFFANCDAQGNQHIGGTTQLIEHELNGVKYRASGYFTDLDGEIYIPFENHFSPVFQKQTRGLKIIIPFLRKQYQGVTPIVRAVCDNFFVAILENKLVVKVNALEINKETIRDIVNNSDVYEEQDRNEMSKCFTPLYLESYIEREPVKITIPDLEKEYHFKLYLQYDATIKRARVAIVRGIGMKIEDKKIKSYVNSPFNGVLIPMTPDEDQFLKSLENESHTELSCTHFKDPKLLKNAKRFINNIDRVMGEIFSGVIKEKNPSDGKIDTSEVIYAKERSFKRDASKDVSTVQLTKGNQNSSKEVVKVKTKSRTNKKQKEKKKKQSMIDKIIRRVTKKDNQDKEKNRVRYSMNPEAVKRAVMKGKEVLMFDFTNIDQYSGESLCNIALAVVDGTGKPYEAEFNLVDNYAKIVDKGTNRTCEVRDNMLHDVSITDGKVMLVMALSDHFNQSLKFTYFVEV